MNKLGSGPGFTGLWAAASALLLGSTPQSTEPSLQQGHAPKGSHRDRDRTELKTKAQVRGDGEDSVTSPSTCLPTELTAAQQGNESFLGHSGNEVVVSLCLTPTKEEKIPRQSS